MSTEPRLVGRKLRDAQGRHICWACGVPRGQPHRCQEFSVGARRFGDGHPHKKHVMIGVVRDKMTGQPILKNGVPQPIIFTIPRSQNVGSARWVDPTEVSPCRVKREERQRMRKQRRAMKERAAREMAGAA